MEADDVSLPLITIATTNPFLCVIINSHILPFLFITIALIYACRQPAASDLKIKQMDSASVARLAAIIDTSVKAELDSGLSLHLGHGFPGDFAHRYQVDNDGTFTIPLPTVRKHSNLISVVTGTGKLPLYPFKPWKTEGHFFTRNCRRKTATATNGRRI